METIRFIVVSAITAAVAIVSAFLVVTLSGCHQDHNTEDNRPVTLLLHGLTWKVDGGSSVAVWGSHLDDGPKGDRWDGMIGHLQSEGLQFGGIIHPQDSQVRLPDCLRQGCKDAADADFFALEFTGAANRDGLAYKTLELAQCLRELRRFTGCGKIRLVAHSAGGLIARAYLQSVVPDCPYQGDVDRLVTIGTPHLGAALAKHLEDLLDVPISSLSPTAPLINRLADAELPDDVLFTAIVVRGIAADVRGEGADYDPLLDCGLLAALPPSFRFGGDQVVHVRSQNLRLAACARRYEARTGRAVQGVLVRVPDPSPADLSPFETSVHTAAPSDPGVQRWVTRLLRDDGSFWSGPAGDALSSWIEYQANLAAFDLVEQEALEKHRLSEVTEVRIEKLEPTAVQGTSRRYSVSGWARAQDVATHAVVSRTQVAGSFSLDFDKFGRVTACRPAVSSLGESSRLDVPAVRERLGRLMK